MPKSPLEKARLVIGALSLAELQTLRDEIANLIALFQGEGVLTGWGWWDLKYIKRKRKNRKTGAEEEQVFGPYLYLRRWIVGADGKRRMKNIGYYGKAGATIAEAHRSGLLKAHNEGGEQAADAFLSAHIGDIPDAEPPERRASQYPAEAPPHPLRNPAITSDQLTNDPIFNHFRETTPIEAAQLLGAIQEWERMLTDYRFARQQRDVTVVPLAEVERRNRSRQLRLTPQPHRHIKTRRKKDDD